MKIGIFSLRGCYDWRSFHFFNLFFKNSISWYQITYFKIKNSVVWHTTQLKSLCFSPKSLLICTFKPNFLRYKSPRFQVVSWKPVGKITWILFQIQNLTPHLVWWCVSPAFLGHLKWEMKILGLNLEILHQIF